MGIVCAAASVSLDGFIAGPAESGFDQLFQWIGNGDVVVPAADRELHLTEDSAEYFTRMLDATGACVVGRRLFDLTNGWTGNPPVGKPVLQTGGRSSPLPRWTRVTGRTILRGGLSSPSARSSSSWAAHRPSSAVSEATTVTGVG